MLSPTPSPDPGRGSGIKIDLPQSYRRVYSDIRALDRALVSDNLPAAREAFNRLQQDSPQVATASHDPFPPRTQRLRALRLLGRCLLRGNLAAAKRAFEHFC